MGLRRRKGGAEAVTPLMLDAIGYVGDIGGAIERLDAQEGLALTSIRWRWTRAAIWAPSSAHWRR
ncbi:MAG TPA: hypothetical protein VMF50_14770 [Candidatus Binataceae bacterium]|nr:hypothetical protein [Candidatus Binataceae bacterium]